MHQSLNVFLIENLQAYILLWTVTSKLRNIRIPIYKYCFAWYVSKNSSNAVISLLKTTPTGSKSL